MMFFARAIGLTFATAALTASHARADTVRHIKGRKMVSIEMIEGAATDCSEYQYRLTLDDYVEMSYVVKTPTDGSDATFSAEVVYYGEAWVSLAVSPDSRGWMVGSEAIIGDPTKAVSDTNPGKFHMTKEKMSGVFLRDDDEQTLRNGNITQVDGETTLTFTKILQEDNEIEVLADGKNYFLWAYGLTNGLGLHDWDTGCGSFSLKVLPCVPPDPSAVDPNPAATPEPSVAVPADEQDEPEETGGVFEDWEDETEGQEDGEEEESSSDSDEVEENPDTSSIEGAVDCSSYQNMVRITDKLTMEYVVNAPSEGSSQGTLSVMMEYDGKAWISIGTAGNPEGKMIGSEAVIGLPDESVKKYYMTAETKDGVSLMEDEKQTLTNAVITQEDGKTSMTFTKELVEPDELPILGNDVNTFVWAVGFNNNLNLHLAAGSFRLPLSPCTESGGGTGAITSVESSNYSNSEETRNLWKSHAVMGFIAWAIFAPVAIAVSWLRKLLQNQGPLWFKLHMYLNILVFVLTIATFGVAVSLYKDADKSLFKDPHGAMGLVITILVTLQAGAGIFRPAAPKAPKKAPVGEVPNNSKSTASDDLDTTVEADTTMEADSAIEAGQVTTAPTAPPSPAGSDSDSVSSNAELKSRKKRAGWEATHKLLGLYLVGMGLWQVQDGIMLYGAKFNTDFLSAAFWSVFAILAFLVLALTVYMRVREVN